MSTKTIVKQKQSQGQKKLISLKGIAKLLVTEKELEQSIKQAKKSLIGA